jgi:ABC-type multidrug transport system fused ATPase/permease subunit
MFEAATLNKPSVGREVRHLLATTSRWRWVIVALFAFIMSLLEVVGAGLVLVLLRMVTDPKTGLVIPVIGDLHRLAPGLGDRALVLWTVAGIGVFFICRAGFRIAQTYVQQRVVQQAGVRISSRIVQGYLEMPYVWHLRHNSAGLIRNAHQSVNQVVGQVFLPVVTIAAETLMLVMLLAVLVAVSPWATLLAICVIGPTVFIVMRVVQPALKRLGRRSLDHVRSYFLTLQESLAGIRDVKMYGRASAFARRFRSDRAGYGQIAYRQGTLAQIPSTMLELALLLFILVFFAITFTGGDSLTAVPILGLFAYAGIRLQPSLQKIVGGLNNIKYANAAVDDVYGELIETQARRGHSEADSPALHFAGDVTFDGVSFSYEGAPAPALHHINLRIRCGESLGICGPTGGGKTTLVDLLVGLLEPTSGEIRIDDTDLRGRVVAWQKNLGLVPQMIFLLDDTVRRNVAFGIDDASIDETRVREAIDLAQLSEFIDSLPEGLDTVVGERGTRLSGGQRQRVAIARALYREPSVLIFDEGTSALDNVTEAELIKTIERLSGNRTVVTVAHRLSTVRNADRVLVIEEGTITGQGIFDELARSHPFLAKAT